MRVSRPFGELFNTDLINKALTNKIDFIFMQGIYFEIKSIAKNNQKLKHGYYSFCNPIQPTGS